MQLCSKFYFRSHIEHSRPWTCCSNWKSWSKTGSCGLQWGLKCFKLDPIYDNTPLLYVCLHFSSIIHYANANILNQYSTKFPWSSQAIYDSTWPKAISLCGLPFNCGLWSLVVSMPTYRVFPTSKFFQFLLITSYAKLNNWYVKCGEGLRTL